MSSPITCHVLDSSIGKPAPGVGVRLEIHQASATTGGSETWGPLAKGATNADGRCINLLSSDKLLTQGGVYRIVFETKDYFDKAGKPTFYPLIEIPFTVTNPNEHYHIPLLISPFSYTTYRGT
ncbi:hypothetical protein BGY98DRAFT_917378 [Russula aff. rugulosa BPL654]|nr:hypothetical protein BGY98DRAFT_917378 [Russula aff. rugulosa BPL654]